NGCARPRRSAKDRGSSRHAAARLSSAGCGNEDVAPALDVRLATQQGAALALGHSTPDAPLDAVVESFGETLGADAAPVAHELGAVLLGSLHEQIVRLAQTRGFLGPILVPHGRDLSRDFSGPLDRRKSSSSAGFSLESREVNGQIPPGSSCLVPMSHPGHTRPAASAGRNALPRSRILMAWRGTRWADPSRRSPRAN